MDSRVFSSTFSIPTTSPDIVSGTFDAPSIEAEVAPRHDSSNTSRPARSRTKEYGVSKLRGLVSTLAIGAASVAFFISTISPAMAQGPAASSIVQPAPNTALPGPTVTFNWTAGAGVTWYKVDIWADGSNQFADQSGWVQGLSYTSTKVPTDGRSVFVRLGHWDGQRTVDGAVRRYSAPGTPALTGPAQGSTLPGPSVTFNWTPGTGVTWYKLDIWGEATSTYLDQSGWIQAQSFMSGKMPTDGSRIWARLNFWNGQAEVSTAWQQYTAAQPTPTPQPTNTTPLTNCPGANDSEWDDTSEASEVALLREINALRRSGAVCNGTALPAVPELTMEVRLQCAARKHSKDMADRAFTGHTNPSGETYGARVLKEGYTGLASENIAYGYGSPSAAVIGWNNSTRGHCEAMMNPKNKTVGTGHHRKDGTQWTNYWTAVFGEQ